MRDTAPKVLISYSHDSPDHADKVLAFSERLRADGIDATIDQYEEFGPPEGWQSWMERQVEQSDFVLAVCTEIYYQRATGTEEPGKGKGIKWESRLLKQLIYENDSRNERFLPVLFSGGNEEHIPRFLRDRINYWIDDDLAYWRLYRCLTDQPAVKAGELGKLVPLPSQERKSVSGLALFKDQLTSSPQHGIQQSNLLQFCEEYYAVMREAIEHLWREGETVETLTFSHQLQKIRSKYAIWISEKSSTLFRQFETALGEIGALCKKLESLPRGPERSSAVDKLFHIYQEVLEITDNADSKIKVSAVLKHLRKLTGADTTNSSSDITIVPLKLTTEQLRDAPSPHYMGIVIRSEHTTYPRFYVKMTASVTVLPQIMAQVIEEGTGQGYSGPRTMTASATSGNVIEHTQGPPGLEPGFPWLLVAFAQEPVALLDVHTEARNPFDEVSSR